MTATRSRKQEVNYRKHRRKLGSKNSCEFCELEEGNEQFLGETQHFKILRNIFPYSVWDDQDVVSHLLIIPKIHTDSFKDFAPEMSAEYIDLLAEFEKEQYNSYTRAPKVSTKSVFHLHTHLIKLSGKNKRLVFYARKPYIRFAK